MKVVTIPDEANKHHPLYIGLTHALLEVERQQGKRVYRVYASHESDNNCYVLTTTSKDVYLGLGTLDSDGHYALAIFLEHALGGSPENEILFIIKKGRLMAKDRGFHITMTRGGDMVILTIAPAH